MVNTYFISSFITVGVLSLGTGLFLKFKKRYTVISVILMIVLSLFSVMIFPFVYTKINLALSFVITFIVIGVIAVPLTFKETVRLKEYEQSDKELADFKKFIKTSSFTKKDIQLNSTISSPDPVKNKEIHLPVSNELPPQDDNIKNSTIDDISEEIENEIFNSSATNKDSESTENSYDNFQEELEQELFSSDINNKSLESTQDTYDDIDEDLEDTSDSYNNFDKEISWDNIGENDNLNMDSDIKKNVDLGIYYKDNDMLETAIEYFKIALNKNPDKKLYFWLVVELTKLYRDTGDKKSATEMLSNYLISNKNNITSEETDKIEILANSLLEDSKK